MYRYSVCTYLCKLATFSSMLEAVEASKYVLSEYGYNVFIKQERVLQ